MWVNYEKIEIKRVKRGKCVACGKTCSRTESFSQTINPFNKDDDGNIKSRSQILEEINKKADEWMEEPLYHVKCED